MMIPMQNQCGCPPVRFGLSQREKIHITSSRGAGIAYIEIENGPYLVLPTEEANDNGERPINVISSNMVWLDASSTSRIKQPATGASGEKDPEIVFLWGKPEKDQLNGTLVKLPAEFDGELQSQGARLQAVVIHGHSKLKRPNGSNFKTLEPGSYVSSEGQAKHEILCEANEGCLVYVRSVGNFTIHSN